VAGLYDALTTTDHKAVGRLWLRAGIVLLVAATVVGVVVGADALAVVGADSVIVMVRWCPPTAAGHGRATGGRTGSTERRAYRATQGGL